MDYERDMFGAAIVPDIQRQSLKDMEAAPFTKSELDMMTENIPRALMDATNDVLRAYVEWRGVMQEAKKTDLLEFNQVCPVQLALIENLCWVFALYDSSSAITFDTACGELQENTETIRAICSRQFSKELTNLVLYVATTVDAEYAMRIARRLDGYVSTFHVLTKH